MIIKEIKFLWYGLCGCFRYGEPEAIRLSAIHDLPDVVIDEPSDSYPIDGKELFPVVLEDLFECEPAFGECLHGLIIDKDEALESLSDCKGLGTVTVPSGVVGKRPTVLLFLLQFLPRRGIMSQGVYCMADIKMAGAVAGQAIAAI